MIVNGGCFMYWKFLKHVSWMMIVLTFLVVPCLVSPGGVQASGDQSFSLQPYKAPTTLTPMDKKLLAVMQTYNIVGLSAAVVRGDKIIWSGGYGWADLRTSRPVTPETIFRNASISKMITGTALMQLYEQKKFQLDDDISKYLGYQVRNARYPNSPITFRQLLTHTSSIVDEGSYDKLIEETPELLKEIGIKELLTPDGAYYSESTFADYEPGKGFSYSNFGTVISASLVETISHLSFSEYCSLNIFKPLDMDSSFQAVDIKNWQKIGVLYRSKAADDLFYPTKDDYGDVKPTSDLRKAPLGNALGDSPAGGARMSILDLSKFMMVHINGGTYNKKSILKKNTADLMHGMQWFGNGLDGLYKQKGLYFHITDDLVPGQRLIGHSAEAYGLIGDAYYDPDRKYGVLFLMNGGNYGNSNPYYGVEKQVAKILYDEFAPKDAGESRKIRGKINEVTLTVNDRKLFMPLPATEIKTKTGKMIFIPDITAADALKVSIELDETGNILTYTRGNKTVILTAGKAELKVNGQIVTLLQAPYKKDGHIMVPLVELRDALGDKTNMNFK